MTKEQLEAAGLTEEQIKEVFRLNGIAVTNAQGDLANKDSKIATLETQLKEANDKIEEFKDIDVVDIKQQVEDYKTKFEKAEREGKEKLEALQYETALKDYMSTHKFASDRVKNSIIEDMKKKEFKLEDGKFLGADDYINQLKEKEPNSFANEETNPVTPPNFTRPANKDNTDEPESLGARLARQNLENK